MNVKLINVVQKFYCLLLPRILNNFRHPLQFKDENKLIDVSEFSKHICQQHFCTVTPTSFKSTALLLRCSILRSRVRCLEANLLRWRFNADKSCRSSTALSWVPPTGASSTTVPESLLPKLLREPSGSSSPSVTLSYTVMLSSVSPPSPAVGKCSLNEKGGELGNSQPDMQLHSDVMISCSIYRPTTYCFSLVHWTSKAFRASSHVVLSSSCRVLPCCASTSLSSATASSASLVCEARNVVGSFLEASWVLRRSISRRRSAMILVYWMIWYETSWTLALVCWVRLRWERYTCVH